MSRLEGVVLLTLAQLYNLIFSSHRGCSLGTYSPQQDNAEMWHSAGGPSSRGSVRQNSLGMWAGGLLRFEP